MSTKENKALAKEKRAKERQKKEMIHKIRIAVLVLIAAAIIGVLTYISVVEYKESKEAAESTTSTETTDTTDTEDSTESEDTEDSTLNTTAGTVVWGDDGDTDTWRKIQLNGVDKLGTATSTNPLNIVPGNYMSITENSGAFTFAVNADDIVTANPSGT